MRQTTKVDRAGGLEPQSLLDVGAGPGTAAFAAAEAFGTLTASGWEQR
jgi:ribosomal protein RSM22 (predicted rRNA methylase)